jgi:hypothetical protein
MAIRQHYFAHIKNPDFNKNLQPGDFHIFSTSTVNGTPETCLNLFKQHTKLELVYQSPECWSYNHPERIKPSVTLWIFKSPDKKETTE